MNDSGQHIVYYLDVDHSSYLGTYPSFEKAEEYVLKCVELHAKRRRLEIKHWPAEDVLEDEYHRVDKFTWKGGLYGYRIAPGEESPDPAQSHLELLQTFAEEEWIAGQSEQLWKDHAETQAAAQRADPAG